MRPVAAHCGQSGRALIGVFSSVYSEKVCLKLSCFKTGVPELSIAGAGRVRVGDP